MPYQTDRYADTNSEDMPGASPEPMQEDDKMEGETAMLPKAILAGKEFKPGDEVVLKIVAMHEDEVEVAYATEGGSEDDGMDENQRGMQNRMQAFADKP